MATICTVARFITQRRPERWTDFSAACVRRYGVTPEEAKCWDEADTDFAGYWLAVALGRDDIAATYRPEAP